MKPRILSALVAAACACVLFAGPAAAQEKKDEKQAEVKVSGGERTAVEKLNKAKGAEAKLQAAAEFVKKYPQSSLRPQVVEHVAAEINATQDAGLKASLAETFQAIFTGPGEADRMGEVLLDTYINAGNSEEAFRAAGPWLEKHPEDVDILRRLATIALNASITGNNAYIQTGQQYGAKALALIEADKRPADIDAAKWAEYKTKFLPGLNREVGVLAFRAGDKESARRYLSKAAELKSPDPAVYIILSDLANEDYNLLAKMYTVAAPAEKEAARKKAEEGLDRVIELYAQSLALIDGNAQFEPARNQLRQDLETYYKYRHKSTDGMQQLIDKYKKQ